MTNPVPPHDDLDALPSYRYPALEEDHSDKKCGWVEHTSQTVDGQIQRHWHRVCKCGRYPDRSDFRQRTIQSAPSQAVLYASPDYGYDIHFSTACTYERLPGTFYWIRRCVCKTPHLYHGQSTQQRTNTVRPHAGYGG